MKRMFLILLAVFALSPAISAQDEDGNLQFNGIKILTSKAEVIRKLGKPLSSSKITDAENECRGDLLRLRYSGLTLELEGDEADGKSVIATAVVTSSKWSVSGVRIGESIGEVKKKLKFGGARKEKGLDYLIYYSGDGAAEFIFRKDKLVKIDWEFNFC